MPSGQMPSLAMVDAGPLYAAIDVSDAWHERCVRFLAQAEFELVSPAFAVAEVAFLVGTRLGPRIEASFMRSLEALRIELPAGSDWVRMAQLVEQYADFPLGAVDASVIALAERLGTDAVVTLDEHHLRAVRPRHCETFRILPADG